MKWWQKSEKTVSSGDALQQAIQAVDMAAKSGVPRNMLADILTKVGWPSQLINQAIGIWLYSQKSNLSKTDFATWLKKYQSRAAPAIVVVVLFGVAQASVMLLRPWPMKIMADSVFGKVPAPWILEPLTGKSSLIAVTALMTVAIFLTGAVVSWLSDYKLLKIGFLLNRSIKTESFRHILHLPLFHQERLAKGDYVYRQNVVTNSLSDLVLTTTSSIITSVVMIIGVLAIMMHFSAWLTIIAVVLMPFLYLSMKIITPHMGIYNQKLTKLNSVTASAINEAVDNAETVQSYTLEDKVLVKVTDYWNEGYELSKKTLLWGNILKNSNSLLIVLATALIMYLGGTAALEQKITFGQLFIFMTYMGYLLGPVENLVQKITTRYQKVIDVGRIYDVLRDHEGIENLRKDNLLPPNISGDINFENVSYSYNGQVVFNNLNLHIAQGEKVAIIGPSGGGKSTILKLLPLFIEPSAGRITLGGFDTQQVSLHDLRQQIAWVSQAPQLFSGSILENIYDGDVYRPISMDEVKGAIEVSNVLEFLVKMPLGVNSPVGENGTSLSGGQRQRIAIARSLIKKAPVLCLDEPTAALDAKSENYIRDSLMQIVQDKTVLMVTHRKALLSLMDTVYVLEDGTLRNVNELGGLDSYLQRLEGVQEQQIAKEIADEKSYILPNAAEEHIGLQQAVQPVATSSVIATADETPERAEATNQPQIFIIDHSHDIDQLGTQADDQTSLEATPAKPSDDSEVIIKLH
ncbi:MAG TPA: ABC transporter ATP-binding protein [Candidatus Saccharibacteria bacterium]|jgi:ABC-type bacteriocin/lantibiotic exporter with double-glycine peptidase domain|nr:ABC transporter ATP-binding protein [Candidatus Saccharibacteria bacterium]